VGLEALLRWDHPERGVVAPDDFIRIAEETGLIVALGDWVLEEACRRLAGWRARFPARSLRMSVNLSGRQLLDRGLPQRVADILARTGVPTSALCLEITENVFIEGDALPLRVLQDLKALRVELQMDDFGTGYSSLAYLHRLPIDTLKIDRSFVGKLGERTHGAIVRGIVDLAKTLGLDAVAEGVETEGQLRALEATPCRYGQGFLFSRPLEPDAVDEFLS